VKENERGEDPFRRRRKGLGYYDFFDEKLAPKNTIYECKRRKKGQI